MQHVRSAGDNSINWPNLNCSPLDTEACAVSREQDLAATRRQARQGYHCHKVFKHDVRSRLGGWGHASQPVRLPEVSIKGVLTSRPLVSYAGDPQPHP
eukprot:8172175-Pyramimonas_sp.AAC.1